MTGIRFPIHEVKGLSPVTVCRSALGATQPPIRWVPGSLSPG